MILNACLWLYRLPLNPFLVFHLRRNAGVLMKLEEHERNNTFDTGDHFLLSWSGIVLVSIPQICHLK